jgi:hypothetical protein
MPYIRYKSLTLAIGNGGVEPRGVRNPATWYDSPKWNELCDTFGTIVQY